MYCSKCGGMVPEGASFCSACGQPIAGNLPVAAPSPAVGMPQYTASIPQLQVLYAGFWLRVVAAIIDGIILCIPFFIVFAVLALAMGVSTTLNNIHPGERPEELMALLGMGFLLSIFLMTVVGWLYYATMESSSWQATLGKKVLGLYVTDLAGDRVSFGKATGRFLGKVLFGIFPILGPLVLYPLDCIMAGFTAKKQALHDMIASCLVLRKA